MAATLDLDRTYPETLSRRGAIATAVGIAVGTAGVAALPAGSADAAWAELGRVIGLTNQHRRNTGRRALVHHAALSRAAAKHSTDQARMRRMTHTGSDGSNCGTRILRERYAWGAWGENVAAGQANAAQVMQAWMASAGHRANILSSNFTQIGIGAVTGSNGVIYWTMVLARGR